MAAVNYDVETSIEKIFHSWDLNSNGFIEKSELATCCSELNLTNEQLDEVFGELDHDKDGQISFNDFNYSFKAVGSLFQDVKNEVVNGESIDYKIFEKQLEAVGARNLLTGQDYVSELFQHLHSSSSTDSPQLLSLLESFLFSVVKDVKNFSEENQRLEDALKRTCEKHADHMEQLDDELEQQMSRLESRVRKEERSKSERQNLDVMWQLENKNKELQTLNAKLQKLELKFKKKQPEEQKQKEEYEERLQEIRYLKSQLTDAQTNLAILRSELAQLRDKHEDQSEQLEREKATILDCVQEQESLTRQLHLLHEANKKLHDTNDDLRSALEIRKSSTRNSPSPIKRHSISVLSTCRPSNKTSRTNSRRPSPCPPSDNLNDDENALRSASLPLRIDLTSTPLDRSSSRRASLLPSQQSCEVDDDNEYSLLNELMAATHSSAFDLGADDEEEMDEAYNTMPTSERDALQQQLRILQESNSDLRLALKALSKSGRSPKSKSRRPEYNYRQQPSIHSDYGSISSRSITPSNPRGPKSEEDVGDGCETEELSGYEPEDSTVTHTDSIPESEQSVTQDDFSTELEAEFKRVIEEDEEDLDEYDVGNEELAKLVAMTSADTDDTDSDPDTETELPEERGTAVGADSLSESSTNTINTTKEQTTPERMYKVVLAGDAAVGKSSFILRLCRNRFHSALNSTLGVDFQMKTMEIDGRSIALQLWDTAGQERFRSIAKSYFRKADGVLLLYDVTCETSFLNVRDWVDAIEESCSKSIPIMMCGNKTDLRVNFVAEGKTVISSETGRKLARDYGALFCETSAKEGSNVQHACIELARILQTIEDQEIKDPGINLTDNKIKAKKNFANCCKT